MSKATTEKIKRILRTRLPKCISSSARVYVPGNIPMDKCVNAISAYARSVSTSEVIGLIDTSLWGNGKKGMLFTETGYYYTTDTSSGHFKYSDGVTWNSFSGFNVSALNTMLKELHAADSNRGWDDTKETAGSLIGAFFEGLAEGLSDLIDEANSNKNE